MVTPQLSAQRLASLLAGSLTTEPDPGQPAYRELASTIRLLIADGRIALGTRLPSERALTQSLGVSRTTIASAYAVLRERGYLESRRGSGSLTRLPQGRLRRSTSAALFTSHESPEGVLDLTCAAPRAVPGTAEAYEAAITELPGHLSGPGYLAQGLPELRAALANRFSTRGLATDPDQIIITSGALSSLGVVARAVLSAGDAVMLESPTYPNAVDALRRAGMRLVAVPMDASGWDIGLIRSTLASARARAAYLIPDFQNPTGALMPDRQRAEVADALRAHGTMAIVDETIAEVDLRPGPLTPPAPFAAHLPGTITIGSASKSHWGGLRVGWIRAESEHIDRLIEARATVDFGAPILEQLVLLHLLRNNESLATQRRTDLQDARSALAASLTAHLPDLRFAEPPGGLSLWVELPTPTATALAMAAEDEGLLIAAGPRFSVAGGLDRWIRLPYVLSPADLNEAVSRLAAATERVEASRAGRGPAGRVRPLIA